MKTNRLLAAVVVLQGLTLAGQWVTPSFNSIAQAQVPDAGAQRIQILDEIKSTNAKLDKLIAILDSGKLQVRATLPDDKKDAR